MKKDKKKRLEVMRAGILGRLAIRKLYTLYETIRYVLVQPYEYSTLIHATTPGHPREQKFEAYV